MKSDGSFTYFAADVAYFKDKYDRHFDEMIYVLGADHGGYVKRLEAVARAISGGSAKLVVLLCQLVKLYRDGEPVRMSKRAGEFVTLRDVVDEVGRDPVRFMMLYRKNDAPLDFDFAKVTEQSKDNPVFYVQYASARCHSVFRQARRAVRRGDDGRGADGGGAGPSRAAGRNRAPAQARRIPAADRDGRARILSRIGWLSISTMWRANSTRFGTRGTENPDLRFLKVNDRQLTYARLGLVQAVSDVLTSGLTIIGADAPTEMR